jgi:hypothetical protein
MQGRSKAVGDGGLGLQERDARLKKGTPGCSND